MVLLHREHPAWGQIALIISLQRPGSGQFTVAKFLVFLIKSFKKLGLLGQRNSLLLWPIVCLEIVYLGMFFPLLIKAELKKQVI